MTTLYKESELDKRFHKLNEYFQKAIDGDKLFRSFADEIIVWACYLESSSDPQKYFKCRRNVYNEATILCDLGGVYLRSVDIKDITNADYQFMLYLLNSDEGDYYRLFHF